MSLFPAWVSGCAAMLVLVSADKGRAWAAVGQTLIMVFLLILAIGMWKKEQEEVPRG